ncbi:HAD family hydrolase [Haladaptatus sp. DYF46]|uniref:HAD family hydrolase n=1 Tax=Haladaptatus sp. DYF46 TaxID=2886041 RepID=UPI001E62ADFF|nr:HAD family hydrolase [Haladaptatus sp. DYF46]
MVRDETGTPERNVAVYFDIDGTLLEKRRDEDEIVETATAFDIDISDEAVHDFDGLVEQYFRRNISDGYREAVETFTDHLGIDVDTDAFTRDLERRKVENTRLVDGAEDVLNAFADVAVVGIITNGAGDVQREKLARHGIADYFEHVLVSGELDTMKPKDEMFTRAKREQSADEYVYVADRLGDDLVPASQNGFVTVWISDGSSEVADITVPSVADLSMKPVDDAS